MIGLVWLCAVLGLLSQEVLLSEAQVIQTNPPTHDLKSWVSPADGVLATENTPVYGLKKKENSEGSAAEYELYEHENAMKHAVENLRKNKPDAILEPPNQRFETDETSSSSSYPTIVYPEILVIIDFSFYQKLNSTVNDAIEYTLAYWTGVDLIFRKLENPKFRLNIVGILLVEHPDALHFVENTSNRLETWDTLVATGKWLYDHNATIPFNSYDIAVLMTGKRLKEKGIRESIVIRGTAFANGTCDVYHYEKTVNHVVIVADRGDFQTIHIAAHEISHSFGVDHDKRGSVKCPAEDGTIMSEFTVSRRKLRKWSQCSLDDFTRAFSGKRFNCVRNRPKQGTPVPRVLPGKLMSLAKQCDTQTPGAYVIMDDNICRSLHCEVEIPGNMVVNFNLPDGAADGSECSDGKICISRRCVLKQFIV